MKSNEEIIKSPCIYDVQFTGDIFASRITLPDCGYCTCVWGRNENGYEHVSVAPTKIYKMPSWNDMAKLKDIFFESEEEAYQIMPKNSEYVNLKENCLHIWRPVNGLTLDYLAQQEVKHE